MILIRACDNLLHSNQSQL